ncbi:MAG: cation transporting ATPase C-terminal domain-containing protein [Oscillospiraceae bacterium]|nr:cation transporting ATPase C-terminal domain-containing protein [Oscillospiraceae bacterium]
MGANGLGKNIKELESIFSTDKKQGLSDEQYIKLKRRYGENIIDSPMLERHNFYGLKNKNRSIKSMLTASFGVTGILYLLIILSVIIIEPPDFDFIIYICLFTVLYIFPAVSAFIIRIICSGIFSRLYGAARPKALVMRNNLRKNIYIENIVPGDVILLSAGDIVPADARLVFTENFSCIRMDENGGLIRMEKTHEDSYYDDNIVLAGDVAESGSSSAIVIATGKNTRIASKRRAEKKPEEKTGRETPAAPSFMQRRADIISRNFFLASVFLSVFIIVSGIIQGRDTIQVIFISVALFAAGFSEQIPVIADFALIYGMKRLSESGILIKNPLTVDEINNIDLLIAKKNESFTQDEMQLERVADIDVSNPNANANAHEIGRVLIYMAMCSNTDSSLDKAVFEALRKCGLNHDGINQSYQKMGKTVYNHANGIRSSIVLRENIFNLVCFGEALSIIDCCPDSVAKSLKEKTEDLYKSYDLVMAVAAKSFNHRYAESINSPAGFSGRDLNFMGFACFSETKSPAVFESADYLKKGGVAPVMIADSDNLRTRNAAVKLGVIKDPGDESAEISGDGKIAAAGEDIFYINSDKIRLFAPAGLYSRVKLLKALEFRNKYPAVTINDISELILLNERCVSFASASAEAGVLKNKASVIVKNLTLSVFLKTVRDSVLIYRNICRSVYFACSLFISQYLIALSAIFIDGGYILNSMQILFAGTITGFMLAVSMCFGEDNKNWDILRKNFGEYKDPKKFNRAVLKRGLISGVLIFLFTSAAFSACLIYINPGELESAQTAAFVTYITSHISVSVCLCRRLSDLRLFFRNRLFSAAFIINLCAVISSVFISPVREILRFGEISILIFLVSVCLGLTPPIILAAFKNKKNKDIFFG